MAVAGWLASRRAGSLWEAPIQPGGSANFEQEYELGRILGRGGFGEVFLARSKSTGVEVAVKVLFSAAGQSEEAIKEEIRAMSRVSSVYSVSVIEAFAPREGVDGRAWRIVLELCLGRDLGTILKERGALGLGALRSVAAQLATAVLHIHSCGVVHRDLKPGNVMVEGGDVDEGATRMKLIDFGLAVAMAKSFERRYVSRLRKKTTNDRVHSMRRAELSKAKDNFTPPKALFTPPKRLYWAGGSPENTPSKLENTPSKMSVFSSASVGSGPSRLSLDSFEAPPAGTRSYAAPELLASSGYTTGTGSAGSLVRVTVSVDAYALGCVLKYCATGVPPEENVMEFISTQTGNPLFALVRLVRGCRGLPVAQYRYMSNLPEEVRGIIKGLVAHRPEDRLTVTQLCESDYVANAPGLQGNPFTEQQPKAAAGAPPCLPAASEVETSADIVPAV